MSNHYAIIGDVHGCSYELESLLELISKKGPTDRHIVSVGDICDKGQHFADCFRLLRKVDATVVIGNHDDWHLRYHAHEMKKVEDPSYKNPMNMRDDDRKATYQQIQSLDFDAFEWMKSWPTFYRIPEHNVVVVHGGLEKDRPPEKTKREIICRVRNLLPSGQMCPMQKMTKEMPFWADVYEENPHSGIVVYGHANALKARVRKHSYGIDTSAVYGIALTALLLPEFELVSVVSKQKYCEPKYEME